MARYSSYPTLYDEVRTVSITKLKEWEYLEPNQNKNGSIKWSRNGNTTGSISVEVNTIEMYVRLFYTYRDDEKINYKIGLEKVPSNLGRGYLWYFICPHTNKRCRKLYLIGSKFLHREAFKGCMYECQTKSTYTRQLHKYFTNYLKIDEMEKEIYSKHYKSTYNGKLTKHQKKYWNLMQRIGGFNFNEMFKR